MLLPRGDIHHACAFTVKSSFSYTGTFSAAFSGIVGALVLAKYFTLYLTMFKHFDGSIYF